MTPSIARRLGKLEATMRPPSLADMVERMTQDEATVTTLDLSRIIAADPAHTPDERAAAVEQVRAIEAGIVVLARRQQEPQYQAHLAWCRRIIPGFVPAVCTAEPTNFEETADVTRPRAMERRATLRARPDIAALIAEGARA